ncbi:B12-binding domain-containing protein [Yoonia sp.]|uniref:cobalamin B12-binding domain-containing protein n=1 Tax=Yoonia sp. TaxID=2212373 RepID=UPI0023B74790
MAKAPMNDDAFDRVAYQEADQQFRLVSEKLPRQAVTSLAREVVRRLEFRMPRAAKKEEMPSTTGIDALCEALLSTHDRAADDMIVAARRDGVRLEVIYLGYVAGAARRLGQMWDNDEISFAEVTIASGKLYRMIRALRHVVAPAIAEDRDERPAMFALAPGETHSLGIEIATDIFRREGWDVDMLVGLDHDTLVARSETRSYRAIVLVANSDTMLEPLTRLVLALRISHPLSHLVVAGHILDHHPDISTMIGADAVIKDIDTAVSRLQEVMDGMG